MAQLAPDLPGEMRKLRWLIGRWLPVRDLTCTTKNGTLTFSSHAGIIARRLYSRRQWSWDLLQRCQTLLIQEGFLRAEDQGPNGTLLNIGAHIGSVYVPLMNQCRFAQGAAFEPSPSNFKYLEQNVTQNGLEHVSATLPFGLSDENRTGEFELSAKNCGDNRVRCGAPKGKDQYAETQRKVVTVDLRRLDDVVAEHHLPLTSNSLIWMDVQGHEGQVFRGAKKTISRGLPVVTEFWPYGIHRSGMDRESYLETVAGLFSDFYRWQRRCWVRSPINTLDELYRQYESGSSGTDVILIPR